MKKILVVVLFFCFFNPLNAQYGGYCLPGSQNYMGSSSSQGVYTNITYNDGSVTSAASAIVYFIGSAPNTQHQILSNLGGASATQIGQAVLQNGTGGLLINNASTGIEIITNFNFNGQNGQVKTLRNAGAIAINNLHIDANATVSGSNNFNNVNGYLKKDGDAAAFLFPLSDGAAYGPLKVGAFGAGNSISAAYYSSDPSSAGNFEGGPFPTTSVSLPQVIVSSTEYWNVVSSGTPNANLSLTFQGDYSSASLYSLFILGWKISTSQWEIVQSSLPTGLTPGNAISSYSSVYLPDYAAFTLGYIPPPVVEASSTGTTCGQSNGTISVAGQKGIPPYLFSIDSKTFQSSVSFTDLDSGNYIVTIKDSFGLTDTVAVHVKGSASGGIFAGNDTSIAINQPLQLNVVDLNNAGYTQFTWSPPYGLNDPSIQDPVTTLDKNITYTVTAVADNGCRATAKISIKVYQGNDIYVPTAFTPNGDGKNDILKAIPIGLKTFSYFEIYDRWGQRVFYTTNASKGWDGRIGNRTQDAGTYVWVAEGVDDNGKRILRKGTVILIR
ncbi:MAG TPA: gliding motility-associated C-terminal domain-containing protein [Puia sp.]|nr:gliding motility-associated C-terminal domain-containing protein [Puia sp.]